MFFCVKRNFDETPHEMCDTQIATYYNVATYIALNFSSELCTGFK